MAADLSDIVLSYPGTPSEADTTRMLESYRVDNPEMYQQWVNIETHPISDERDALKEVQLHGLDYLKHACTYSDFSALIGAWASMRRQLLQQIRDRGVFNK